MVNGAVMTTGAETVWRSANQPRLPPYTSALPAMLETIAEKYASREAIVRGDDRVTYRELQRQSAELAKGLLARGVSKGMRVGLLMPNSPRFAVAFMAAARIGAVVAPLSTLYQAPELAWVLNNADIDVLLISARFLRHDYLARLEEAFPSLAKQAAGRLVLPEAPFLRQIFVWGDCNRSWAEPGPAALAAAAAARPEIDDAFLHRVGVNITPADALCMIHTSGSTANPKGVVHGHGPLIRHTYKVATEYWSTDEGDRIVTSRPWFWVAGLSATLFHALHLGLCLIVPEDNSGSTLRGLIETEGATAICSNEESWLRSLRTDPHLAPDYDVIRIVLDVAGIARRTADGWAYVNPARAARIQPVAVHDDRLPRIYGMTETCGAHTGGMGEELLPPDRPRGLGRPFPTTELKVVDVTSRTPLGPGHEGELLVRADCLMLGMYKREPKDVFLPDGFYATGDVVSIDEQGYVSFSHRIGEMIKVHGANVAPLEVEAALQAAEAVQRCAVVGVEGPDGETLVVAAVEVWPGHAFDEAKMREELKRKLSSYKVPRRIFLLTAEEIPMTGSGKIQKKALAEVLHRKIAGECEPPAGETA